MFFFVYEILLLIFEIDFFYVNTRLNSCVLFDILVLQVLFYDRFFFSHANDTRK